MCPVLPLPSRSAPGEGADGPQSRGQFLGLAQKNTSILDFKSPPERPATAHGPACSTGSLVGAHRPGFPSRSQTWQEMKGFTSLAPISASSPCRMGRGELLLSSAAR